MKIIYLILILLSIHNFTLAQNILKEIISEDRFLTRIAEDEEYEVQIIYTQINRDKNNKPSFSTYKFNADAQKYFYPASSVKFPAAVLALEKLNDLNIAGLNSSTSLKIDSSYSGQSAESIDSSSQNNLPSIAHYIKKIFLVSDNNAYNRLYEFLGQKAINTGLHTKGFSDVKLIHRLSVFLDEEENRRTNAFRFFDNSGIIYEQAAKVNRERYHLNLSGLQKGKAFYKNGELVEHPMDFSSKNYISLSSLHNILKTVIFPESVSEAQRFNLTKKDYDFLYKYMSMKPRESSFPEYDEDYWDSYGKFFIFGDSKNPIPDNIRIFNKIGLAYGFLIDNAYIVDFENGVEFLLSAVIYVNEDGVLNDDNYEYDKIGIPFLAKLGTKIYNYEINRKRNITPDLSRFKFKYKTTSEKE